MKTDILTHHVMVSATNCYTTFWHAAGSKSIRVLITFATHEVCFHPVAVATRGCQVQPKRSTERFHGKREIYGLKQLQNVKLIASHCTSSMLHKFYKNNYVYSEPQ